MSNLNRFSGMSEQEKLAYVESSDRTKFCPMCGGGMVANLDAMRKSCGSVECQKALGWREPYTNWMSPNNVSVAIVRGNDEIDFDLDEAGRYQVNSIRKTLLLILRKNNPFAGSWALPAGFIDREAESCEAACVREVKEETGVEVDVIAVEKPVKPERGIILTPWICKAVGVELSAGDDAADAKWFTADTYKGIENLVKMSVHKGWIEDYFAGRFDRYYNNRIIRNDR